MGNDLFDTYYKNKQSEGFVWIVVACVIGCLLLISIIAYLVLLLVGKIIGNDELASNVFLSIVGKLKH